LPRPPAGGQFGVPRERLFAGSMVRPAVPWPGFQGHRLGKTTLAASYVEARRMRSLWYQVDADAPTSPPSSINLGHAARKLEGASAHFPAFAPARCGTRAFARKFFAICSPARRAVRAGARHLHAVPPKARCTGHRGGDRPDPEAMLHPRHDRSDPQVGFARYGLRRDVCLGWDSLRVDRDELRRSRGCAPVARARRGAAAERRRWAGWC